MFRLVYVEITAGADLLKVLYANRKFHIQAILISPHREGMGWVYCFLFAKLHIFRDTTINYRHKNI